MALAIACLSAIDELRDDYGPAESEPRHPDIDSGGAVSPNSVEMERPEASKSGLNAVN
jgi:hypothetical protein